VAPKQKKDSTKTKRTNGATVEMQAYSIFLERQRDGRPGDHLSDWYEAEHRLSRTEQ
jgi:hypothetical protein